MLQPPPEAEAFYSEVLQLMAQSGIPFLVSGTYALASYTGIDRPTKDVDVFAKAGDALKMLHYFKEHGFDVEIVDERWLSRITRGELFVDIITNMPTVTTHVTDEWFIDAPEASCSAPRSGSSPDAVHLVEDLRPGPSPLRQRRRRAHDPQVPRSRSTGGSC